MLILNPSRKKQTKLDPKKKQMNNKIIIKISHPGCEACIINQGKNV